MHSGLRGVLARYLSQAGVSQRGIARLLRLDRGTVARVLGRPVAAGRRLVVVRRCPCCGGWVQWPCRACRLRKELQHAAD